MRILINYEGIKIHMNNKGPLLKEEIFLEKWNKFLSNLKKISLNNNSIKLFQVWPIF